MIAPWGTRSLWETACFDPVTVLAGVAALGAATSAAGSIAAGNAQASAGKYDQEVDRNNAIQAQQATDQQSIVSQQQTTAKLGQQKVAYGASGVDVNTGTPLDVMTQTATQGKLAALNLRYGGAVQATNDLNAGTLAQYEGDQAQTASYVNAGSTLLTGAGNTLKAAGYGPQSTSW